MEKVISLSNEQWDYFNKMKMNSNVVKIFQYKMEIDFLKNKIYQTIREAYSILENLDINQNIKLDLDLHGFDINQSKVLFILHYQALKKLKIKEFNCIYGIGVHSLNGCVLKKLIEKIIKKFNLKYEKKIGKCKIYI